jgi:uncharacterized protein YjiS (DUF1127 family)
MTFARTAPFASLFSSTHAAAHAGQPVTRASVAQMVAAYRANQKRAADVRATVRALAELDDAGLADIGLHRSQVLSVARDTAAKGQSR